MTGNKEFTTLTTDKMNKAIKILDDYENQIGLPAHDAPGSEEELNDYFTWDRSMIEQLPAETLAACSYRLAQYSVYIQREANRETATMQWAKHELDDAVVGQLDDYDKFMKFEMKVVAICRDNSYANALRKIMIKAEQRVDRLTYLSTGIKNLSDNMKSATITKGRRNE